jgi:energy-coupling factor transport system ATP-binding protein
VLEFVDVSYSYPGAEHPALEHVELSVAPGKVTALLGANGSGKSTLARMSNGIIVPQSGSVTVDGASAHDIETVWDVRRSVGMVFQNPDDQIVGTVVEEDVAFGPENLGISRPELRERVSKSLEAVGLSGLERREPHLLSGGQKQRLAIAGALAMDPAYLVLDEVKTMLDPQGRDDVDDIVRVLAGEGRGVLMITHDLADLGLADDVVVLAHGRTVFAGDAAELVGRKDDLATWGLSLPPIALMAEELRGKGAYLPALPSIEGMVDSLWP